MAKKIKAVAKVAEKPTAIPVESDRPGIPRNPKPKKLIVPLAFVQHPMPVRRLEVVEIHLAKLLERLAADYGGIHAQAVLDLKADLEKAR